MPATRKHNVLGPKEQAVARKLKAAGVEPGDIAARFGVKTPAITRLLKRDFGEHSDTPADRGRQPPAEAR